jgi:hypothetical protein
MIEKVRTKLMQLAPHIAFSVYKIHDDSYVWDGDGPDPKDYDEPMDAYDVTFTAKTIICGNIVEGNSHLGGSYFKHDEPIGDCHGYLLQKLEEAFVDLGTQTTDPMVLREIEAAQHWLKQEMQKQYDFQVKKFYTEVRFGQEFIVREGIQNISQIWSEITEGDGTLIPSFLITSKNDGSDGLYWTSWEECLIENAVHQWNFSPNLLTEQTMRIDRDNQSAMDLMDVIGFNVVELDNSGNADFSARLLSQLSYQIGKRRLKTDMNSQQKTKAGLVRLLRKFIEKEQTYLIDLMEIAGSVFEDANDHNRAAACRILGRMTDGQIKQFVKEN